MAIIYHITSESEWKQAVERGYYEALSLKDEGFIHFHIFTFQSAHQHISILAH